MKNLKPIEWSFTGKPLNNCWYSDTVLLGQYYIYNRSKGWYTCWTLKDQKLKGFRSLDDAKAFCSAHHAALVASLFDDSDTETHKNVMPIHENLLAAALAIYDAANASCEVGRATFAAAEAAFEDSEATFTAADATYKAALAAHKDACTKHHRNAKQKNTLKGTR